MGKNMQSCQVTLDISGSPIFNGASGNIQDKFDRYDMGIMWHGERDLHDCIEIDKTLSCCLLCMRIEEENLLAEMAPNLGTGFRNRLAISTTAGVTAIM